MISIIVPVYNVEKYIHKCIDSILAQTFVDFELILVNDGSLDKSGVICDKYAEIDDRIRVIHKENGGQSTARNVALDIAKGKYIGFIDGDDYIDSNMFEILYNTNIKYESQISVCGRYNVFDGKIAKFFISDKPIVMNSKESIRRLLVYNNMDSSPCDKLFEASLFDNIRFPKGYICEDVAVVYKLLENSKTIVHTGKPLYYYLQREGSTSKSSFSEKTMGLVIYHKQVSEYVQSKYPDLKEEANYFYFSRLIYTNILCYRSNEWNNTSLKNDLRKRLKDAWYIIIKNQYISKRDKFKVICINLNLYSQFESMYKKLRLLKK